MNDNERDQIVKDYIQQAMSVQNKQISSTNLYELKEDARGLGMTDADMTEVEKAAREHCERGGGYCRHGRWAEAIEELKVAVALNPTSVEAIYLLAEAHAGK